MATPCQYNGNALKYLYSPLYFITARDNIYRALYHVFYYQYVMNPKRRSLFVSHWLPPPLLSPDHADVGVRLGEGPGAGGGRAVAAGVPGVPVNTH